ncbi:MAG: hypothetical protein ACK42H_19410 [Planctomycetota bacterium]|jgi:hypothetical protein
MNTEEQRKRNRELMPNVAKMMDEWRAVFPDLKLIWAKDLETGHEVGKKSYVDPNRLVKPSVETVAKVQTTKSGRRR